MSTNWLVINIVLTLSTALVCSVLVNIFFWLSERRNKSEKSKYKHEKDKVYEYLGEQSSASKHYYEQLVQVSGVKVDRKVLALRTAYLNIERKAYSEIDNDIVYWKILNERIIKLLKIFVPKLFVRQEKMKELENRISLLKDRMLKLAGGNSQKSDALFKTLLDKYNVNLNGEDSIENVISQIETAVLANDDSQAIRFYGELDRFKNRMEEGDSLIDEFLASVKNQASSINMNLNTLEENKEENRNAGSYVPQESFDEIIALLEVVQKDNQSLREYAETLKEKWRAVIEKGKDQARNATIMIKQGAVDFDQFTHELSDINQSINELAEEEVNRLRTKLDRQGQQMQEIEKQNVSLHKQISEVTHVLKVKDESIGDLSDKYEQAKYALLELEKKLIENHATFINNQLPDSIKNNIDTLMSSLSESFDIDSEGEVAAFSSMDAFFKDALQADSLEDLASMLFFHFDEHFCDPAVEIKFRNKSVMVSKSGEIPQKDRIFVENMAIDEVDLNTQDQKILFHKRYIKGVLSPRASSVSFMKHSDYLAELVDLVDKMVKHIGATQVFRTHRSEMASYQNVVKKMALNTDKEIEKQNDRNADVVKQCVAEIITFAQKNNISEVDLIPVKQIESDALEDIDSNTAFRLKLRKQFLELIGQLDGR